MDKLFQWGIIKSGDKVVIKNFDNSEATVMNTQSVEFNGVSMTFNAWGEKVTGWSAVNIYEWTIIKGLDKTLHELRQEKMMAIESDIK